ncbi:MAG: alpha/beta hydrolase [bacterium]|nr:alpha/beta hydrolase [bacterium]
MRKQIIVIHGGDCFTTYEEYISFLRNYEINNLSYFEKRGWKSTLQEKLGDDFEVIAPQMPNKFNAKYLEWKIWFEKIFQFLNDDVILLGHSLGGAFLAKYLSENIFPKLIRAIFLISAPYNTDYDCALVEFAPSVSLTNFEKQCGKVFLYHSKDDPVVAYTEFEKYKKELPHVIERVFENRGHFIDEEFPEIIEDIKNLI